MVCSRVDTLRQLLKQSSSAFVFRCQTFPDSRDAKARVELSPLASCAFAFAAAVSTQRL